MCEDDSKMPRYVKIEILFLKLALRSKATRIEAENFINSTKSGK